MSTSYTLSPFKKKRKKKNGKKKTSFSLLRTCCKAGGTTLHGWMAFLFCLGILVLSLWTLETQTLLLLTLPTHGSVGKGQQKVTDFCRFGVLLPDAGLTDPEVSSSSAEDQEDKSCKRKGCIQQLHIPVHWGLCCCCWAISARPSPPSSLHLYHKTQTIRKKTQLRWQERNLILLIYWDFLTKFVSSEKRSQCFIFIFSYFLLTWAQVSW